MKNNTGFMRNVASESLLFILRNKRLIKIDILARGNPCKFPRKEEELNEWKG